MSNNYTINQLKLWKNNQLINPKTNKTIKKNGPTYKVIEKEYQLNKNQIEACVLLTLNKLLSCDDNRDPISMNLYWIEKENVKSIVYPLDQLDKLIFYNDKNNKLRCLEKDSIIHLKTYNMLNHPVTMDPIPKEIFDSIDIIKVDNIDISIEDYALNVFQLFAKKSIFLDHRLFIELDRDNLLKFNTEIKDIWIQNLTSNQRSLISNEQLFSKNNTEISKLNDEKILRYFLKDINTALECDKDELSLLINYIIIGALGIVIPQIKNDYGDVIFSFS
jgi:hypothetical protein